MIPDEREHDHRSSLAAQPEDRNGRAKRNTGTQGMRPLEARARASRRH